MSQEQPRKIKITFRYVYPDLPDKTGVFLASNTIQDVLGFLGIDNFDDYRIYCMGVKMWPLDLFGMFAFNEDELNIQIWKKHPARTKQTKKF